MMNLSAGVPAVVSIWKYQEKLTPLKLVAFGLAVISILLLFWGKRVEEHAMESSHANGHKLFTWLLLMVVVLLANGMSSFGLKMIAGWSLPGTIKYPYLTAWYAAGLVTLVIPMLFRGMRFGKTEVTWGCALAVLSIAGQLAMAVALDSGVPGHVVFPVAISGSIFVVALAGRLAFGERMNRTSAVGVALGVLAVVLLGAS
jgi:multidrug transporter EmrE-like cation transporter